MFDILRGETKTEIARGWNMLVYFVEFKHGNLLLFDKQHKLHPTLRVVQSRGTKGKGRGGACYLGNNSESPWGKDVATDL